MTNTEVQKCSQSLRQEDREFRHTDRKSSMANTTEDRSAVSLAIRQRAQTGKQGKLKGKH